MCRVVWVLPGILELRAPPRESRIAWWVNSGFDLPRETIAEQMTLLIAYGAYAAAGIVDTASRRPRISRTPTT
jgi:hypothetical protein